MHLHLLHTIHTSTYCIQHMKTFRLLTGRPHQAAITKDAQYYDRSVELLGEAEKHRSRC